MIVAAILSLAVAMYCYAISQLQQHGKLKFEGSFWNEDSWVRKYKWRAASKDPLGYDIIPMPEKAPDNWYYRFLEIKYKERFPLSATLLVFTTDGYHLFQALFFSFLSLSFALAIGFNWWLFLGIFIGVRIVHWSARKILSK